MVCSKFGLIFSKRLFLQKLTIDTVLFPFFVKYFLQSIYLCKDPKEDIESTYWQTVCFQWGHSEEDISEKAKYMPLLTADSTNNVPTTIPKYFLQWKVLENLSNWTLWTFLSIILSQVYLWVSVSCFSEKKFKA